jgi:hypothetical protein
MVDGTDVVPVISYLQLRHKPRLREPIPHLTLINHSAHSPADFYPPSVEIEYHKILQDFAGVAAAGGKKTVTASERAGALSGEHIMFLARAAVGF